MRLRVGLLPLVISACGGLAACAGPNHEIVEDRFDLADSWGSPEVT